jgi:hypothetical protein
VQWRRSPALLARNLAVVHAQLHQHLVAAALTSAVFEQLQQDWADHQQQQQQQNKEDGQPGSSMWRPLRPPHAPLLKRATEPSLEERFGKAGISLELLNRPGGAAAAAGQA